MQEFNAQCGEDALTKDFEMLRIDGDTDCDMDLDNHICIQESPSPERDVPIHDDSLLQGEPNSETSQFDNSSSFYLGPPSFH